MKQWRGQAFCLVELLVIVAIIAILIALLTPALSQAKEISKQIACGENLRQIGNRIALYANENSGNLVPDHMFNVSTPGVPTMNPTNLDFSAILLNAGDVTGPAIHCNGISYTLDNTPVPFTGAIWQLVQYF